MDFGHERDRKRRHEDVKENQKKADDQATVIRALGEEEARKIGAELGDEWRNQGKRYFTQEEYLDEYYRRIGKKADEIRRVKKEFGKESTDSDLQED